MSIFYPSVLTKKFILKNADHLWAPSLLLENRENLETLDVILTTYASISLHKAHSIYGIYLGSLRQYARVEHLQLLMRHTKLAGLNSSSKHAFVCTVISCGKTDVLELYLNIMREEDILTGEFFQELLETNGVIRNISCLRILLRYARGIGYTQIKTTENLTRCLLFVHDSAVFDELFLYGFDVLTRVTGRSFAQELLRVRNEEILFRLYNLGVVTEDDMCNCCAVKRRKHAPFLFSMNHRINESDKEDGREATDRFLRQYLRSQEIPLLMARALLVVYQKMSCVFRRVCVNMSLLTFIREFCPEHNPVLRQRMEAEKRTKLFRKRKHFSTLDS
jgi:hypothetical protein